MTKSPEGAGDRSSRRGRPRDSAVDEAIILAARDRLVRDGYSKMTIGDIVADAKVTRPTLYRRWNNKFDLVVDALDYGFRQQVGTYDVDLSELGDREALVEAVRRVDPAYFNPNALVLMGNFAGEALRTPQLLEILRTHAVEPRVALVETALHLLQQRGAVRGDIDVRTIATMCFGAYFAAFYRGDERQEIAERVVAALWPGIAAGTSAIPGRRPPAGAPGRDRTAPAGTRNRRPSA